MSRHAFFLVLWVLASPCAAVAEDIAHVARPGDTPVNLSKTYRVPVAAILSRNKGLDPCRIKVGDVIFVPVAPGAQTALAPSTPTEKQAILPDEETVDIRYVVVPGDIPVAIAERFGISLDILARANPGLDPRNLAVGRVLAIPRGQACPVPIPVARPGDPPSSAPLVMDFQ
jgi:LysM repeat protein